jgi:23S rRNA pseudouridine1911/1915/1917 synthase
MWVVQGGRPALSHFHVLELYSDCTLVSVVIETGRTHQIRVHLTFIGHPVVGDSTYGNRAFRIPVHRQLLHASYLRFELPSGSPLEVETALPEDMQRVLQTLRTAT